jgi:ATP-dependent DNA helicase RecG
VFGTRQSGVPTFRVGDLRRDRDLLDAAREQAARWLDGGEAGAADLQVVARLWQDRFGLIGVG